MDLSVNRLAWELFEKLEEDPDYYGVKIEERASGATIVDAGIEVEGGFEAGRLITEICMGGCGKARIESRSYGDMWLPSIFVYTDHPVIATLGSQYAGWQIKEGDYFAIGSGPARALAQKPREICKEIRYKDACNRGIVVLETDKFPPDELLKRLAKDCRITCRDLGIILTPTASLAGAVQVSGRIVETGIHKLRKLGLAPNAIRRAWGSAPIPPVHPKFRQAMARSNDAILYGGIAAYAVACDDENKLIQIIEKASSGSSEDYGKPFLQIFKNADFDFYKIDPNLFSPAVITINNESTGNAFSCGELNTEVLKKSFSI
jgi:methenyltetrahydromethanopterin cyclohydrolase